MKGVLVLDGRQRSALAMTRSLGKRGVAVHVADSVTPCLAGQSRYAMSQHTCPDASESPDVFVDWVANTSRMLDVSFVLPTTDTTTMLLAPLADRFGQTKLLCAAAATYELVSDKAKVLELADRAGIRTPASTIATTAEEIAAHLAHCGFPAVIKPFRSKTVVNGTIVTTSVMIVNSQEDAVRKLAGQPWLGHIPCLIQEHITGHGAGIFTFFSNDRAISWFSHKRIREKPPSGGVSVLSESVAPSPALVEASNRLLLAANWNGLAMLEFKITNDGAPYLMEINGRPWGSMQLSIDCGVDFPSLLYQSMTGTQLQQPVPYRVGRRLRWLLGDIDNLLIQLKDGNLGPGSKLRALGQFLGTFADLSCRQEIFRWSDPAPAFCELRT